MTFRRKAPECASSLAQKAAQIVGSTSQTWLNAQPFPLLSLSLSACRAYSSRRSKAKSEIGTMMAVQRGSLSRATAAYVRARTHMRGGKKRARCDVLALKGSHHKGGSENIMRRRRRRVSLEAETEPPPTGEGRDAAASRCSRRPRPRYTFMLHTYFLAGDIFSPRDDTKGLRAVYIHGALVHQQFCAGTKGAYIVSCIYVYMCAACAITLCADGRHN